MAKKSGSRVVWPGFNYKAHTRHTLKVGRNDPCPCGSGKKYKDCHESAGSAYLTKLAEKQARQAHRDGEGEGHRPWYRRLLGR